MSAKLVRLLRFLALLDVSRSQDFLPTSIYLLNSSLVQGKKSSVSPFPIPRTYTSDIYASIFSSSSYRWSAPHQVPMRKSHQTTVIALVLRLSGTEHSHI